MSLRAANIAMDALERLIAQQMPADRCLKRTLRAHPDLDNDERRHIARSVHGARCFSARLTYLLGAVDRPATTANQLALYWMDQEGIHATQVAQWYPTADIDQLSQLSKTGVEWPTDPVARLAVQRSLPGWLAKRLIDERGREEADALADASNRPGPIAIRANTMLTSASALRHELVASGVDATLGTIAPDALRLSGRPDIRGSSAYVDGRFEVQDEGSQLIALAVGARPGETVIDLCAGAGGKTLAMAAAMRDTGHLWAADPDGARLADLTARLTRVPLRSVRSVQLPSSSLPARADRVLVDAPCSATGTFRRGPDRRWRVLEADIAAFAQTQRRILADAAQHVRPGGRLVYATCSVLAEENDEVADAFTADHSTFRAATVLPGLIEDDTPGRVHLLPHRHDTDGFFIAAWQRRDAR